jgi:hypothetical protein
MDFSGFFRGSLTFNFLRYLYALWPYCNGGMTLVEKVP